MQFIEEFIKRESSAGIVLMFATVLALIFSNAPVLSSLYAHFLHLTVEIRIGSFHLSRSLAHWVNEGLMAIFFLLVGLEVKREILEENLSSINQALLPAVAAVGGMVVPALVYVFINRHNPEFLKGWAIPTATDIAFALGVLSILGRSVPSSLKVFLMALAIIDDLGAIIIIAAFYTSDLSTLSLISAAFFLAILIVLNLSGVTRKAAYFIVGVLLWISVLKSGVHATLAGVALAFTIPLKTKDKNGNTISPLREIEHNLHLWVAFLILPLFAFVNAGVELKGIRLENLFNPVPAGIMLGLFLGKQAGVFGFSFLFTKILRVTRLPEGVSMKELYGLSVLTGIGFTMSLFINSLAFGETGPYSSIDKLAILAGSLLSGLLGYGILKFATTDRLKQE